MEILWSVGKVLIWLVAILVATCGASLLLLLVAECLQWWRMNREATRLKVGLKIRGFTIQRKKGGSQDGSSC